jgi:tape measure domain-containing protein
MIKIAELLVKIGADSKDVDKELDKTANKLMDAGGKMAGAGAILSAGITAPIVMLGKSVISAGMAAEQSQVAFSTLLGSGEKAKVFLGELQDFAAKTPFEFNDLEDASKRMLAFGFSAEQILPMLTAVGDATSGLGVGSEGVNRVVLALGQMQAKAKASSQEMMQLTETGIPAWKYLASAMGITTGEAMKMVEKGLVPAEQAINAITQGMEQDFGGMMAAQMNTAAGGASNLADAMDQLKKGLGTAILPEVKNVIERASELVSKFNEMDDGTKKFIMTCAGIAAGTGPALMAFGGMSSGVGAIISLATPAANGIKTIRTAMDLLKEGNSVKQVFSAMTAGMSSIVPAAAIATAAIVAVGVAYDKTVGKANREGKEAVSTAWSNFFVEQQNSGKGAADILTEYEAAQARVNKELENAGILKIFIKDQETLTSDTEGLNNALAQSATTYQEYLDVASKAAEPLKLLSEAQWDSYHAVAETGQNYADSAAGLEEIADSAEDTKTALDGLYERYNSLQTCMQDWLENTASKVMNSFGQEFPYATEEFKKQVMGINDEVFGTSYLKDYEFSEKIDELNEKLHQTKDLDAYKKGLQDLKNEGLADMRTELEDVVSKSQSLYDNLLALPRDIQIKIGFDDSEVPDWIKYGNGFGSIGVGNTGFGVTVPSITNNIITTVDTSATPGAVGTFNGTVTTEKTKKQALGGPVWSDTAYMVGERGPEMFVPSENGRIEPNPIKGVALTNYGNIMVNSGEAFGAELLAALAV